MSPPRCTESARGWTSGPELLFTLRGVDHLELIAETAQSLTDGLTGGAEAPDTLDAGSLGDIFGIEMEGTSAAVAAAPAAAVPNAKGKADRAKAQPKGRQPTGKAVKKPVVVVAAAARQKPTAGKGKVARTGKTSTKVPASKVVPKPAATAIGKKRGAGRS